MTTDDQARRAQAPARLAALIPAWNPGDALARTLDSIAVQTPALEIFVVDDGSEPAIELPPSVGGKAVHLIRLAHNQGITAALNAGLAAILEAGFDFIARHDCGDVDERDRLARQLEFLAAHEDVMLVGSSVDFTSADGRVRFVFRAPESHEKIARKMRYSAGLVHSSCMFRAQVFRDLGLYSARYPHAEDYDLFFRMLARHPVRNLGEVLVLASYDTDGISVRNRQTSLHSRFKLQLKHFDPLSIHSYLGLVQTLCLRLVPYRFVVPLKSLPLVLGSK